MLPSRKLTARRRAPVFNAKSCCYFTIFYIPTYIYPQFWIPKMSVVLEDLYEASARVDRRYLQ